MLQDQILVYLKQAQAQVSGEVLAKQFHVSRQAISKAIRSLNEQGFMIEVERQKGYRYHEKHEPLHPALIDMYLNKNNHIYVFDEVTSTNDVAKQMQLNHLDCVVANMQTKGRGRLGRVFYSPKDTGIYLSVYANVNHEVVKPQWITSIIAIAVKEVLDLVYNIDVKIKWVNDLFYQGKKVAGILTETTLDLETQVMSYVIIGVGINLNTEQFPDDLIGIAGGLGKPVCSRNELIAKLIERMDWWLSHAITQNFQKIYEQSLLKLGEIVYYQNEPWQVEGVDEDCGLKLKQGDHQIVINSGEITWEVNNETN